MNLNGEKRRAEILKLLQNADTTVNATELAGIFGVTRQIIVADIALLRASGISIRAEHRGYVIDRESGLLKKIVCKHGKENVANEFYAIVDHGGSVIDIQIEHPIYGLICANISICSRYDADEFVRETSEAGASQLSSLTDGIHIHTIKVKNEEEFARIEKSLDELGILIKD